MPNQERPTLEPGSAAELPHAGGFGLVKISGPEAKKFLQGQLTCNLEEVSETQSRLGAHCNPQGRVLFLFRIFLFQSAYYLVLPREIVSSALLSLKKYAPFFKLELSNASENSPTALMEQAAAEWRYFDLSQGIPQVYPETSALFLPHELKLHELQGLSWDKGCYTGQEIIARMHYKGKLKNHLYRATLQTPALPRPGAELLLVSPAGRSPAGFIVDYRQVGYNLYQLLVLTQESNRTKALQLDPEQIETWEWLN